MRHHGLLRSPRREVTCSCPEHHKAPRKCDSVRRRGIVSLPRLLRGRIHTAPACKPPSPQHHQDTWTLRPSADATWTPRYPHCRSHTVQPCAMVPWAQGGVISPYRSYNLPSPQLSPRQAKQRHSAPCQLGHTLMMKPPDDGPPHSSNGEQPTHQAQAILRRINIRTSMITNEYRGMTCSQNDRTVDNTHDGASNRPPRSSAENAPRIKTNIFQYHTLTPVRSII